jgi:hypothetical protein
MEEYLAVDSNSVEEPSGEDATQCLSPRSSMKNEILAAIFDNLWTNTVVPTILPAVSSHVEKGNNCNSIAWRLY